MAEQWPYSEASREEGIAEADDVPMLKLADGIEEARAAVEAMYAPGTIQYERAMMVIDMAEKQGAQSALR